MRVNMYRKKLTNVHTRVDNNPESLPIGFYTTKLDFFRIIEKPEGMGRTES